MANTTWNPSDKTAGVTLSGGNLIATTSAASDGVRGAHNQTSGKYYWEYTYTTIATNSFDVGLALSAYNFTSGTSVGAAFVVRISGTVQINGTSYPSLLGTIASGARIGVAADFTARLIWFRVTPAGSWNGSGTADPATGAGGLNFSSLNGALYPLFIGGSTDACTANFGDTAFGGTVPSGFTSGFPAGGGGGAASQARVMVMA